MLDWKSFFLNYLTDFTNYSTKRAFLFTMENGHPVFYYKTSPTDAIWEGYNIDISPTQGIRVFTQSIPHLLPEPLHAIELETEVVTSCNNKIVSKFISHHAKQYYKDLELDQSFLVNNIFTNELLQYSDIDNNNLQPIISPPRIRGITFDQIQQAILHRSSAQLAVQEILLINVDCRELIFTIGKYFEDNGDGSITYYPFLPNNFSVWAECVWTLHTSIQLKCRISQIESFCPKFTAKKCSQIELIITFVKNIMNNIFDHYLSIKYN